MIKQSESGRETTVVALTAHALEEERQEILAAGCDDFVRKPYRNEDIFQVTARHLDLRYLYEDDTAVTNRQNYSGTEFPTEKYLALPADLRSKLHEAVLWLDTSRTQALIKEISAIDSIQPPFLKPWLPGLITTDCCLCLNKPTPESHHE